MALILPLIKPVLTPPPDLLTGLLSLWEFNYGSALLDETASNRDLTGVGTTGIANGKIGYCLEFDGVNDCLKWDVASDALNTNDFTISAWIQRLGNSTGGSASQGGILSKYYAGTGYRCYGTALLNSNHATYPNGFQTFYYNTSNAATSYIYSPGSDIWTNNWKHVVFTKNGTTTSLYIDGEYVGGAVGTIAAVKQSTTYVRDMIGAWSRSSYTPDCFFKGYIDQVAKWNLAFDENQISALYNSGDGLAYANW